MSDLIHGSDSTVRLSPPVARWLLHCDPQDSAVLATRLSLDLPDKMLWVGSARGWSALHLAPDEWLLIGDEAEAAAMSEAFASLANDRPLSLIDISDRDVTFDIQGEGVERLLAAGCPMDLAETAFPIASCTRTLFGKATVMLWRVGARSFRLAVARSFSPYVIDLLTRAADEPC